jgi:cell division inhibitor SepF
MGVSRSLRSVMERFGGADYDVYDDATYSSREQRERRYEERLGARHSGGDKADADEPLAEPPSLALVRAPQLEFGLLAPQSFDEAQEIADRFRSAVPTLVNLQDCEAELAKRLIDFCSGLVYALDGRLQFAAAGVLLLAPRGAELSGDERAGLREGSFFNQA